MIFNKTKINGLFVIEPEIRADLRGSFNRAFDEAWKIFGKKGFKIVQASRSFNKRKGTLRGMHFQKSPMQENKIVQCIRGSIHDVAVDLRKKSKTYGKWFAVKLTDENKKILFVPRGFAHGFQSLTDNCEVLYFMSDSYSPEHASGARWDDPFLKIKWPIKNPILSEKDKCWQLVKAERR